MKLLFRGASGLEIGKRQRAKLIERRVLGNSANTAGTSGNKAPVGGNTPTGSAVPIATPVSKSIAPVSTPVGSPVGGGVAPVAAPVGTPIGVGMAPAGSGSITTREAWYDFVNAPRISKPAMPSARQIKSLSEEDKKLLDSERNVYHQSLPPVEVPSMKSIRKHLLPLITSNQQKTIPGARRGGILDGPGGVGKTTNVTQIGRRYERIMRRKYPGQLTEAGVEYVPVVYVTLPAETTIKGLSIAIAKFYGAVYSSRTTKDEIGYNVIDYARRCATSLIIVDDIHFLDLRSKGGRVVNDHLKYLANQINATFIYAGIECEASGLLHEGHSKNDARFSQMRRRFGLHRVEPFTMSTEESTNEWKTFLRTVESRLALANAHDGMLSEKLYKYIFDRTDGYIGAVSELVAGGALEAIQSGEEKITKGTLSGIALDYASQKSSSRRLGINSGSKSTSKGKTGSSKTGSSKKGGKSGRTSAYATPSTPNVGRVTFNGVSASFAGVSEKGLPGEEHQKDQEVSRRTSDIAVPVSKPIKTA